MPLRLALAASWFAVIALVSAPLAAAAPAPPEKPSPRAIEIASPDGHLQATISVGDDVRYSLALDERTLVTPSAVSLTLADGKVLGRRARVLRVDRALKKEDIPTPIGKRAVVRSSCVEAVVLFADGSALRARLFDDGLALRWETSLPGQIRVVDEGFSIAFADEPKAFFLAGPGAHHGYEGLWRHEPISSLWSWSTPQAASLPLVLELPGGPSLAVLQADLHDYPAMYLSYRLSQPRTLVSLFPRRVTREQPGGYLDLDQVAAERADDIALTAGTRTFPWRALLLARRDADLLASDMVTRLAPAAALVPLGAGKGASSEVLVPADTDWIKPGKVVWDYWANWNLEGVDFVAGRNTATFEHHVDFAARHGFAYINIDWLWSDPLDLMALNSEIDVPGIVRYARERKVGVFLWCLARTLETQLAPAMDRAQQWGVAGLKIDFFDRDDQRMIALYERFAAEAAKRKLLVLFHGATAPSGLSRAYPNVLSYEGVRGLEYDKFDERGAPPDNDVTLPFTRMLAGPMDYTPGAMRAQNRANWKAVSDLPSAQGTLAHQLAMYVVYDAPLVMLSDMPSAYEREPAALEMLEAVPTTWDETVGVDGRIGQFAVVARKKGDEWWLGAMTDWSARSLEVPLAFTGGGAWEATLWTDGLNADKVGTDYRRSLQAVDASSPLRLALAPGGGAVVRLRRK